MENNGGTMVTKWLGPGLTVYLTVSLIFVIVSLSALYLLFLQTKKVDELTQAVKKMALKSAIDAQIDGAKQKND
jgi:hypothetical protein